ncbi:hypothetical protein NITLEN_10102 [Nitrospira lenta]|uniref:Uncharacterized protein n=1 Tax=Nitrospira lenta TaxID=1436998 RepID=A0A330L7V5_9BACT|nr:hypothetical protein NITLEN_10102 [Nitrospira lenta]
MERPADWANWVKEDEPNEQLVAVTQNASAA